MMTTEKKRFGWLFQGKVKTLEISWRMLTFTPTSFVANYRLQIIINLILNDLVAFLNKK